MPFDFIGGSYTALSPNVDAQRTVNLYLETNEAARTSPAPRAFLGTPGLTLLCTLPDSPVRGVLATDAQRLFVTAGQHYYEVNQTGAVIRTSSLPDDGLGNSSPVTMIQNGTQVLIMASNMAYLDDGTNVNPCNYQNGQGTVTTSGTAVTWISGSQFDSSNVGFPFVIGAPGSGVTYTVDHITDATHLVLTASAGTQTGSVLTGTVDVTGTLVTRDSGSYFDPDPGVSDSMIITIGGTNYTVSQVTDPSTLTLTSPVPTALTGASFSMTFGVYYTATYPVQASSAAFLDGYYIVSKPASRQINISAINDGSTWNPLDFAIKEGAPDGIQTVLADHEELWIFGNQTIEVWNDTGAAAFPLQRNPSGFIPTGNVAPASPVKVAGSVGWLGSDSRGGTVAYLANGFIPVRVSTYAIEAQWAAITTVDARSYAYTEAGHDYWVISLPTANQQWVFDVTEKTWHERQYWNGATLESARSMYHGYVWNEHITGDKTNGNLYISSVATTNDNGAPIYRIRSASHIVSGTEWEFFSQFILQTASNTNQGTFALDWSDDGGKTFCTPVSASAFRQLVTWRRLGKSRDRIFRVTYIGSATLADPVAWTGATLT